MGAVLQLLATHKVSVCRGVAENHRQQGIAENHRQQGIAENHRQQGIAENHRQQGIAENHRQQCIAERFNHILAERLFGFRYAKEMLLSARGSSERSAEWVGRLPTVIKALCDEATRLTGRKPSVAIKDKSVAQKPSMTATPERPNKVLM